MLMSTKLTRVAKAADALLYRRLQLYNRSDVANVAVQYFLCSAAGDDEFDTLNSNQSTTFSIPIFFGSRLLTLSVTITLPKLSKLNQSLTKMWNLEISKLLVESMNPVSKHVV